MGQQPRGAPLSVPTHSPSCRRRALGGMERGRKNKKACRGFRCFFPESLPSFALVRVHQPSAISHLTTNPTLPHLSPIHTHKRKLACSTTRRTPYPPRRQPSLPPKSPQQTTTHRPHPPPTAAVERLCRGKIWQPLTGVTRRAAPATSPTPLPPPNSNIAIVVHHCRRTRRTWWGRQAASPLPTTPRRPPSPNPSRVPPRASPPPAPARCAATTMAVTTRTTTT